MDPTGSATQWQLSHVEVTNPTSGACTVLSYKSYLNEYSQLAYLSPKTENSFKVLVHTSDRSSGSFDGDVYLALGNHWSASEEIKLVNAKKSFAPGSAEEFTVKASDLDYLTYITMRVVRTTETGTK